MAPIVTESAVEYQERRRRQNKLAQRRYRERTKQLVNKKKIIVKEESGSDNDHSSGSTGSSHEHHHSGGRTRTSPDSDTTVVSSFNTETDTQQRLKALEALWHSLFLASQAMPNTTGEAGITRMLTSSPSTSSSLSAGSSSNAANNNFDVSRLPASLLRFLSVPSPRTPSFMMPSMHYAKALYENTERMGVEFSVIASYEGLSYIAESWDIYRKESAIRMIGGPATADIGEETKRNFVGNGRRLQWDRVPKNMQPTDLQLTIEHHPFIDVGFVWPSMRQKILQFMDSMMLDDDELCHDSVRAGLPGAVMRNPAFTLWGDDAMDEEGYEVGEEWAAKYWFLLDENIIKRTNWWRRQRSLPPLQFPSIVTPGAELSTKVSYPFYI